MRCHVVIWRMRLLNVEVLCDAMLLYGGCDCLNVEVCDAMLLYGGCDCQNVEVCDLPFIIL
jgi:hypothetical protein